MKDDWGGHLAHDAGCLEVEVERRARHVLGAHHLLTAPPPFIHHSVEFAGFVAWDIRGLGDHICTTQDPNVNCVRQVDF